MTMKKIIEGRRSRGRPNSRWSNCNKEDLEFTNLVKDEYWNKKRLVKDTNHMKMGRLEKMKKKLPRICTFLTFHLCDLSDVILSSRCHKCSDPLALCSEKHCWSHNGFINFAFGSYCYYRVL